MCQKEGGLELLINIHSRIPPEMVLCYRNNYALEEYVSDEHYH